MRAQIAHHSEHFVGRFAQPEHQAGLGGDVRPGAFRVRQNVERAVVPRAQPDLAVEPRHGLGVMVHHVRSRFEHHVHGRMRALKIRDQNLDPAPGHPLANRANGEREQLRAAVLAIVPVYAGDYGVLEPERSRGLGHTPRLVEIQRQGGALPHRAETAPARADVAEDHERRRAVMPALTDVRAVRFLTDSVQVELAHELLEPEVVWAARRAHLEPARLPLGKLLNAMTTSYLIQCVAHEPRGEMMTGEALPGPFLAAEEKRKPLSTDNLSWPKGPS
jgi:hypothetical protein